jgi:hypothetical protein
MPIAGHYNYHSHAYLDTIELGIIGALTCYSEAYKVCPIEVLLTDERDVLLLQLLFLSFGTTDI